ncbi:hypothetical protein O6H91_02G103000 [Diphasiastrum complanatum]|uniref:Uncharacterized protein n=1 Tax=Diphasiastrum complanatum TaxID=34168 RepID=A0ACC2EJ46_DIPCM|nr:hypothetical protein O6H91_02G103000 [Diphasiastrum complanatum]
MSARESVLLKTRGARSRKIQMIALRSTRSPFQMDEIQIAKSNYAKRERDREKTQELDDRTCEINSRGASDEEGCNPRKKLRLSKEQFALLEESFKEHSTLNPNEENQEENCYH